MLHGQKSMCKLRVRWSHLIEAADICHIAGKQPHLRGRGRSRVPRVRHSATPAPSETWGRIEDALHQHGKSPAEKLICDWILFIGAMLCPSDVNYFSSGLCAHVPFIEHVVDFKNLKNIRPDYLVSAYCIEDAQLVLFRKNEITTDPFRASMSFPFLYPPYRIGNKHYLEGAAYQCLPLARLVSEEEIDNIVLIDVMTDLQGLPDMIRTKETLT
jgi:predicted acylesterase/phospholipase RssA